MRIVTLGGGPAGLYFSILIRKVHPDWPVTVWERNRPGDAFGFVDPMLSPGVFLALRSAELLSDGLAPWLTRHKIPSPDELDRAMAAYARVQGAMLGAWLELVAYFYDGRMAALMRAGRTWNALGSRFLRSAMDEHVARHVGLLASGAATTGCYSRTLLRFLSRFGLRDVDPAELAIR